MTQGFGGMADATGVNASFAFAFKKAQGGLADPETDLPPTAAITDFMAVWEQGKRLAHWSQDRDQAGGRRRTMEWEYSHSDFPEPRRRTHSGIGG